MHYVLIVMLFSSQAANINYQEFNSKQACEHAQMDIVKQLDNSRASASTPSVSAFCEKK